MIREKELAATVQVTSHQHGNKDNNNNNPPEFDDQDQKNENNIFLKIFTKSAVISGVAEEREPHPAPALEIQGLQKNNPQAPQKKIS